MSDGFVARIFFGIGIVLALASMVLGPFGIEDWAIAFAFIACLLSLTGIYLAFQSWNEKPPRKPVVRLDAEPEKKPEGEEVQP